VLKGLDRVDKFAFLFAVRGAGPTSETPAPGATAEPSGKGTQKYHQAGSFERSVKVDNRCSGFF